MFQSPSSLSARNLDPYTVPLVSLSPVSDEQQTDENLEPPFIRVRSANGGFVHIDGGFPDFPDNVISNTAFTVGNDPVNRLYTRKIQRFSLAAIGISLATPNINPRNNVVIFETAPGVTHTGVIPEGVYTTIPTALAALQAALSTAVPPAPAFTVTQNPLNPLQATVAINAGVYRFFRDPTNLMLVRGETLFNLSQDTAFTASKTIGATWLQYSRYIDICSSALTKYSKNPTSGNQAPVNLYARVYLNSPIAPQGGFGLQAVNFAAFGQTQEATNFRRDRAFEQVDISLFDDEGQPFYIPSLATATPANVNPSIVLTTEI